MTKKRYAAFISHHQRDSAMEARYLKEQLEAMFDTLLDGTALDSFGEVLELLKENLRPLTNSNSYVQFSWTISLLVPLLVLQTCLPALTRVLKKKKEW